MSIYSTVTHKNVRDLAWAINSPSLTDLPELFEWHDSSEWFLELLQSLNNNPEPLLNHLQDYSDYILGSYFEGLWHFYFLQHPNYELLAKNIQLHAQTGTVGELDIIVRDIQKNEVMHIELACKFYCNIPKVETAYPLHHWVGPALKDRLDEKYQKLINKQIPLIQHPLAKHYLDQNNITVDKSLAIIKGRLFYYQTQASGWLELEQADQLNKHWHYKPLIKQDWFATQYDQVQDNCFNPADLQQWIAEQNLDRPIQVAAFNDSMTSVSSEEQARFFIAPRQWIKNAEALITNL